MALEGGQYLSVVIPAYNEETNLRAGALEKVTSYLERQPYTYEVVVTDDGCEVITKFPAESLLVAGRRFYAAEGPLPAVRETASHLNR